MATSSSTMQQQQQPPHSSTSSAQPTQSTGGQFLPVSIPTMTGNIFPTNDAVKREVTAVNVATNTKPERLVEIKWGLWVLKKYS